MKERIRLFAEVDGVVIPIHIDDDSVFDVLGIVESTRDTKSGLEQRTNKFFNRCQNQNILTNGHHISNIKQLTSSDIAKYLMDNIDKWHENKTVANYFGIDIDVRKNKMTPERKRAYEKVNNSFKTARKHVERRIGGFWKDRTAGIKNQRKAYRFVRNEKGDQIAR